MSEFDVQPDPNFWGPLLEVSHRDAIDEASFILVRLCHIWFLSKVLIVCVLLCVDYKTDPDSD